jgi:integrase
MNMLTDEARATLVKELDGNAIRVQSLAIKLLIYTGLRISEALRLEWRDVDFDRRSLYIRDAKSGYNESIPLNETALSVLSEALKHKGDGNLVFPSPEGKVFNKINQFWNTVKRLAKLPEVFRLHDLRHDFASRLANTGEVSLQMIGRLLRHRSAAMTQRYAHLVDETLRKASEKIK